MPLSLFRLLVLLAASLVSAHASQPCPYAAHMAAPGVHAAAGVRQALSFAAPSASDREVGSAGAGKISLSTPPGQGPAVLVGVVTRGKFLLKADGQPPRVIGVGGAFIESAGAPGLRLDSATSNASARMIGLYLPKTFLHRPRHMRG